MDYSLVHALAYWKGALRRFLWLYDVNCQYHKLLYERIRKSLLLQEEIDLDALILEYGIGLFHVHGHQDTCHCRYAPSFMEGAAFVVGEVIESLWEPLNEISGSSRAMTYFHRQETLDMHMNDSNWKKTVRMGACALSIMSLIMLITGRDSGYISGAFQRRVSGRE